MKLNTTYIKGGINNYRLIIARTTPVLCYYLIIKILTIDEQRQLLEKGCLRYVQKSYLPELIAHSMVYSVL